MRESSDPYGYPSDCSASRTSLMLERELESMRAARFAEHHDAKKFEQVRRDGCCGELDKVDCYGRCPGVGNCPLMVKAKAIERDLFSGELDVYERTD